MMEVALILIAGLAAALAVLVRRRTPPRRRAINKDQPWLLLVDDDAACRNTLALQLAMAGWQTETQSTAEEALTFLDSARPLPRLIITDVVMPGLDGWGLAAEIRRRYPEIPILFISGMEDIRPQESRVLPDHVPFLSKPIDRKTLLQAVESIGGPQSALEANLAE